MWVYYRLQCKRLLRLVPVAAVLMLVLALSLTVLLKAFVSANRQDNTTKVHIAICGDTQDNLIQMGYSALQTMDESRFALEILEMTEEEASRALRNSEISAYIRFPEGFTKDVQRGILRPLEVVTTPDTQGLVLRLKTELSSLAGDTLLSAQRSVFGGGAFMEAHGHADKVHWYYNDFAIDYAMLALLRGNLSETENLGIGGAENLFIYLGCGLSVVFLCLCCLNFAPAMIRTDAGVSRMLTARGFSGRKQGILEFCALAFGLGVLTAAVAGLPLIFAIYKGIHLPLSLIFGVLGAVVTLAAISFFFYSLSGDLIGGVLLQFFGMVSLSFLSGCMYPGFFFPEAIQKLGQWLPMGICRRWLMSCFAGKPDFALLLAMGGVAALAVAGGTALRCRRAGTLQGVNP